MTTLPNYSPLGNMNSKSVTHGQAVSTRSSLSLWQFTEAALQAKQVFGLQGRPRRRPCCQLLSHCRVWDPDFQSLPLLELLSTLLFTLDIGLLACASLTPVRVSGIFKPFQLFVFVPFCWDLSLSVRLISHNWHHKFVFLLLTVYCREGSRLLPWY